MSGIGLRVPRSEGNIENRTRGSAPGAEQTPFPAQSLQQRYTFLTHLIYYRYQLVPCLFHLRGELLLHDYPELALGDALRGVLLGEFIEGFRPAPSHLRVDKVPDRARRMKADPEWTSTGYPDDTENYQMAAAKSAVLALLAFQALGTPATRAEKWRQTLNGAYENVPDYKTTLDDFIARYRVGGSPQLRQQIRDAGQNIIGFWQNRTKFFANVTEIDWTREGCRNLTHFLRNAIDHEAKVQIRPLPDPDNTAGLFAVEPIPSDGRIITDRATLVVQDTGNRDPPYYCSNCYTRVTQFSPISGRVCCWHAVNHSKDDTPFAPTVYCSRQCQYGDRNPHMLTHQKVYTSAYSCAANGNLFPLFLVKVASHALMPDANCHPLSVDALRCIRGPYSEDVRYPLDLEEDYLIPWRSLLSLGIDIFSHRYFDTWVLFALKAKWLSAMRDINGLRMIYSLGPFYAHSCVPNAVIGRPVDEGKPKPQEESLYALQDIKEGEQITVSFIGPVRNVPLQERLRRIVAARLPPCWCPLCNEQWPAEVNQILGAKVMPEYPL
ncbi:hypothetical protein BDZ91DRAFT_844334 [Kalaharituber pfeilii]|nr:hypothetical protein BDZ91DRAFT_844334 [Kalaharituber pfeilii]